MSKAFGKNLKMLRTTMTDYTEAQMAELLDTDLETYRLFETGELEPSMNRMFILAQVLEIDFVKLFDFEEDSNIFFAQD